MAHSAEVIAGAYSSRHPTVVLTHAVADTPFQFGRLRRDRGEAFCVRALDLADPGAWDQEPIDCPQCLTILSRMAI